MTYYMGVDVGTGSARVALFDGAGLRRGMGVVPIKMWRPAPDFVEQSSDDIWHAIGRATRQAVDEAGIQPDQIAGIGFDATCSLVVLDRDGAPLAVSPDGDPARNIIVWMDHRAIDQAARINKSGSSVLKYVGGIISPEMQPPKLLWLKENHPVTFRNAAHFFDLPDYLVHRATGSTTRSLCSTACKWTYLGHRVKEGDSPLEGWEDSFWRGIGLEEFPDGKYTRIGVDIQAPGRLAGRLSPTAAEDLGLVEGIPVGVSIIDAHAGGLGLIGACQKGEVVSEEEIGRRIALIGGTSSCHMAASPEPRFIDGVWGPYYSAMVPGLWLTEGGQSATGALLDHVIESHPAREEVRKISEDMGRPVYQVLEETIGELAARSGVRFTAELTRDFHVLPYFHGNRSPRADPTLRGVVSGLNMDRTIGNLALYYLATMQAIAYGTRHILDALTAHGYQIDTIMACGGGTKSELYLQTHSDACGRPIVLGSEPEAVLLGAAMLGATASGDFGTIVDAMQSMSRSGRIVQPGNSECLEYHGKKYQVFLRMYEHFMDIRTLMK